MVRLLRWRAQPGASARCPDPGPFRLGRLGAGPAFLRTAAAAASEGGGRGRGRDESPRGGGRWGGGRGSQAFAAAAREAPAPPASPDGSGTTASGQGRRVWVSGPLRCWEPPASESGKGHPQNHKGAGRAVWGQGLRIQIRDHPHGIKSVLLDHQVIPASGQGMGRCQARTTCNTPDPSQTGGTAWIQTRGHPGRLGCYLSGGCPLLCL